MTSHLTDISNNITDKTNSWKSAARNQLHDIHISFSGYKFWTKRTLRHQKAPQFCSMFSIIKNCDLSLRKTDTETASRIAWKQKYFFIFASHFFLLKLAYDETAGCDSNVSHEDALKSIQEQVARLILFDSFVKVVRQQESTRINKFRVLLVCSLTAVKLNEWWNPNLIAKNESVPIGAAKNGIKNGDFEYEKISWKLSHAPYA